ncbi:hypothetical protein [Listeria goaensis]|uniref:hypothetical protein n=2 Tax=Listeria TaxID=1637 RepID=UPI001F088214|nr:hypothetical protein [Listeria goaensis]
MILKKMALLFGFLLIFGIILSGCSGNTSKKEETSKENTQPKNIIGQTLQTEGLHETTDNWTNMYETEFYTVDANNKIIFIQADVTDKNVDSPASQDKLLDLASPYIPKETTVLTDMQDGSGSTGYECQSGDMHFTILQADTDDDGKVDTLYISKI